MKKKTPKFNTDEELEAFLDQDLSDYLHAGNLTRVTFEFEPKTEKLNLRMPASLMKELKKRAKNLSMPYQRYTRTLIEQALSRPV